MRVTWPRFGGSPQITKTIMKLLHYNCQRLGNSLTISHFKDIRKSYTPDIMLLTETKHVDSYVKVLLLDNPNMYCINMSVENGANFFWQTYIYGNHVGKHRREQWHQLSQSEYAGFLRNKFQMMIGNFNDTKSKVKKEKCTWMGKRSKYTIMSRIDSAVANLITLKKPNGRRLRCFDMTANEECILESIQVMEQVWKQECSTIQEEHTHSIIKA
ncbi:hypothetical protein HID58_032845 [Brassica napus]|uniref:Protein FAR1-RELATED SEQUENCE n=1 Tax=Brassica napus TaxID=3708 RepID=A0ABQ8BXQ8_BRANA|nr:hypothetical protein HID58_032845 [Brassica napus]